MANYNNKLFNSTPTDLQIFPDCLSENAWCGENRERRVILKTINARETYVQLNSTAKNIFVKKKQKVITFPHIDILSVISWL